MIVLGNSGRVNIRRFVESEQSATVDIRKARVKAGNKVIGILREDRRRSVEAMARGERRRLTAHAMLSIRDMFEAMVGPARILESEACHRFMESPLVSTAFTVLTSNMIQNAILDGYIQHSDAMVSALSTPMQSTLREEILSGTQAIDVPQTVREGEEYPDVSFGEKSVKTTESPKKGLAISIARETALHDQTGRVMRDANRLGASLAYDRLVELLKVITQYAGFGRFRPKKDQNTDHAEVPLYRTSANTDSTLWFKRNTTRIVQALINWKSINDAWVAGFTGRTDEAGRVVQPPPGTLQIVAPQALQMTIVEALGAVTVTREHAVAAYNYSAGDAIKNRQASPNPLLAILGSIPTPFISPILDSFPETSAGTDLPSGTNLNTWYMGNYQETIVETINWAIEVTNLGPRPERDVLVRYKGSRKSAFQPVSDMYALQCLGA